MSEESLMATIDRLAGDDENLKAELLKYGRELEVDHELGDLDLDEPLFGRGTYLLACRDLKAAGINPEDASEEQLLAAMRPHYPSKAVAS